jgi:hypothetical protein
MVLMLHRIDEALGVMVSDLYKEFFWHHAQIMAPRREVVALFLAKGFPGL